MAKKSASELFDRKHETQYQVLFRVDLSPADRQLATDYHNPKCPLSRFVGNEKARARLSRAAYGMWAKSNHQGGDQAFALIGNASTGKTTLAKLFAETVALPYIDIQPKAVQNTVDVLECFANVLDAYTLPSVHGRMVTMRLTPDAQREFVLPPTIAHIDEVHALPNKLVQALLKATEPKDGILAVGDGFTVDCRNVCWIISTTDRGLLFDAFDTRFRKIFLHPYNREEVAEIVRCNNLDWSIEVCRLVAKYCWRVPREALAFAADMRGENELQHGKMNWEQVAAIVARDNEIDLYGMTRQRLNILVALGQQGAIPRGRLCFYAGCKEEELVKFMMPPLLVATESDPALVAVTSQGYSITMAGLYELDKRKIPHLEASEVVKIDVPALNFGDYNAEDFGDAEAA